MNNEINSGTVKKEERPKWVRVISLVVVIALIGLVIATLVCAIGGADPNTIMGMLLCCGIIPIFIWVFLKITDRSIKRRKEAEKYYGQNQD